MKRAATTDLSNPVKKTLKPVNVEIYTDGSCKGNPGPGGYAGLLLLGEDPRREIIVSGNAARTTNNRMELLAVVRALEYLDNNIPLLGPVVVTTDSNYVKRGITEWIFTWKSNGWRNAQRKPVVNQDLWKTLDLKVQKKNISWHWVKGHSGHEYNERVDKLAQKEADNAAKPHS